MLVRIMAAKKTRSGPTQSHADRAQYGRQVATYIRHESAAALDWLAVRWQCTKREVLERALDEAFSRETRAK